MGNQKDVVAHHVCSSDPRFDVTCLADVDSMMAALGFPRMERFETSEGSWKRFLPAAPHAVKELSGRGRPNQDGGAVGRPLGRPFQERKPVSEYAYDLKLPIHLHVLPEGERHFRGFVEAVKFFTGKNAFHVKKIDCATEFCKYHASCKELYGIQNAPFGVNQY